MIGLKFNRLLVISFSHVDKYRLKHYICQCDCGNIKCINGRSLRNNKTKSCGCLQKEIISKLVLKSNKLKIKNNTSEFFSKSIFNRFVFKENYDLNCNKFIYKLTNTINNKIYIGKTERTLKLHLSRYLYKGKGNKQIISKAINKYGHGNFLFEIIYFAKINDDLSSIEMEFIKKFNSNNLEIGYNLTNGGEGTKGSKRTNEQLINQSLRMKGKFCGDKNPFYGKKHSEETKEKIRQSNKRRAKNYGK
jgi:group I intron endonuclease